ncbi:hypothetical protein [Streptomyces subrutilus]|uniref:hypothetical protein n=1 Tax=Streptomyces subrutilus TaxID=36818 RepID=UPI002E108486
MSPDPTGGAPAAGTLDEPGTPFPALDRGKAEADTARLRGHLDGLGAQLRPHVKTAKGYDLVADLDGVPHEDLVMTGAGQEHGILSVRPGSAAALPDVPVGTRLRILPVHARATAAQHEAHLVTAPRSRTIRSRWPRVRGW